MTLISKFCECLAFHLRLMSFTLLIGLLLMYYWRSGCITVVCSYSFRYSLRARERFGIPRKDDVICSSNWFVDVLLKFWLHNSGFTSKKLPTPAASPHDTFRKFLCTVLTLCNLQYHYNMTNLLRANLKLERFSGFAVFGFRDL